MGIMEKKMETKGTIGLYCILFGATMVLNIEYSHGYVIGYHVYVIGYYWCIIVNYGYFTVYYAILSSSAFAALCPHR